MIFVKMEHLEVPDKDPEKQPRHTWEFTRFVDMVKEVGSLNDSYPGIEIAVICPGDLSMIFQTTLKAWPVKFKNYDDSAKIRGWQCHSVFVCKTVNNPALFREIVRACGDRMRSPGAYPRNLYIGVK